MSVLSADFGQLRSSDPIAVEDVSSLAAIGSEWQELEQRQGAPTPFQKWEWCSKWVEAAAASGGAVDEVRLVVVRENGRIELLWPLAVRTLWIFRIAFWLGEPLTQYGDVVATSSDRSRAHLEAAWGHVSRWRDIDALELRRVRVGAHLTNLLVEKGAVCAAAGAAPFVDFTAVTPAGRPAWMRSSRTRNSLRRRLGELAAFGPVRFEIVDAIGEQREAATEALKLKHDWLKEMGRASVGLSHRATEYFLQSLAASGFLSVARLKVADATAALEIGFRGDQTYYSFLQAYDSRFAAAAPGRLLFWHLIERCPDLGVTLFDFLAPVYPHKLEWATGESATRDFVLPITARGHVAVSYLARIKPNLKLIHAQLPAAMRRATARLTGLQ